MRVSNIGIVQYSDTQHTRMIPNAIAAYNRRLQRVESFLEGSQRFLTQELDSLPFLVFLGMNTTHLTDGDSISRPWSGKSTLVATPCFGLLEQAYQRH